MTTANDEQTKWMIGARAVLGTELTALAGGFLEQIDLLSGAIADQVSSSGGIGVDVVEPCVGPFVRDMTALLAGAQQRLSAAVDGPRAATLRAELERRIFGLGQYFQGYVDGGAITFHLFRDLESDEAWDQPNVSRVLRKRLLALHDRIETSLTEWSLPFAPTGDPGAATLEVDRLGALISLCERWSIKISRVPKKPSDAWLDKLEAKITPLIAKKQAAEADADKRRARLKELMELADTLQVRVKKVPELPSHSWLEKMDQKLQEVQSRRLELTNFEDAPDPETSHEPTAEELTVVRRARIEAMLEKSERVGMPLGRVPDEPTDGWIESTESKLEEMLAQRRAKRKEERERKKRDREERVARLREQAEALGEDLGRFPPFPTEDWLSRAEMRIAASMLKKEGGEGPSDEAGRAERLNAIRARASKVEVELGEVPPDPDATWLLWAEGRLETAEGSQEVFAVEEDPEDGSHEESAAEPVEAAAPSVHAALFYEEGTIQEMRWNLEERTTIGRARSNTIQIQFDAGVSREHCALTRLADGTFVVEDIGSTKGTLLDGETVTEQIPISSGARIVLGDTELVFRLA